MKVRICFFLFICMLAGIFRIGLAAIPTDNLLAHYNFNGNANDVSGNGHHGTVYNATLTTDRFNNANKAYYFDGNGDYIDIGDWQMGGEMSICVWVKHAGFSGSVNNWARVFHFGNSMAYDDWWLDAIYLANEYIYTHAYFSIVGDNSGDWNQVYATNIFSDSEWIFVTCVVQGTTMKIYKNSSLANSKTDAHEPASKLRSHQYLGYKGPTGSDCWLSGSIDDLKIYGRALTDAEIASLYSDGTDWSLPVTLTDFSAQAVSGGVLLTWTTESETENLGFIIERITVGAIHESPSSWSQIASYVTDKALIGHGSTSEKHEYLYTDKAVQPGLTYFYRLADVDYSGKVKWHKEIEVKVEAESVQLAEVFRLGKVYPNPLNATFTIPLTLGKISPVKLALYDLNGRLVKVIEDGTRPAGEYQIAVDCREMSSGIYFLSSQTYGLTQNQKVIIMK